MIQRRCFNINIGINTRHLPNENNKLYAQIVQHLFAYSPTETIKIPKTKT